MAITLPAVGDSDWGPVINTALSSLDTRTTSLESKLLATAPGTSAGVAGNKRGMIAVDETYLYVCVTNYTTGGSPIWRRISWDVWS
jgi:hypothetical protein